MSAPSGEALAFAADVRLVGDAVARVLSQLRDVLDAQRRAVLALGQVSGLDGVPGLGVVPGLGLGHDAAAPAATIDPPPGLGPGDLATAAGAAGHDSAGFARAALYQSAAVSVALALHNAVAAQQQLGVLAQAIIARGAANLLGRQPAASAPAESAP